MNTVRMQTLFAQSDIFDKAMRRFKSILAPGHVEQFTDRAKSEL